MPFDPSTLNKVVAAVTASAADEAEIRTGIGRLYYAAHLTAREGLRKKGWTPTGRGGDHSLVIQELSSRQYRKESDQLEYLKQLREHADYHLEVTSSILNQACRLCRTIRRTGPAGNAVTLTHWQEASDTSNRLFPRLQKI